MRSGKSIWLFWLVFLSGCIGFQANAQTWGEWFRQRHTQKKYLLEQIAALQVYTGYVKKGYGIARDGLGMVRDIADGEFKLHEFFISGLKKVSPAIRNDARIADIVAMEIGMVRSFGRLLDLEGLPPDRLAYLRSVKAAVMEACLDDLAELLLVLTSGKVEMGDSERLTRLEGIYRRMQDRSAFVQDFSAKVLQLSKQIDGESKGIKHLGGFYEINE
ncbi:hypothetical protein [Pedobacter xixiisoli]|uniref:TerB family tellurite resistance protein n=1 Tax=Pedobacter xixiisoli TaxID=1476464 RepID=A0A285ZW62_9SPHI|nr:hypothetical protein [Pedobacter xixiisoli]SOD13882.1 hypothetical protein SAMN06297358_1290 [Pedobacter xixiisoli]